MVAPEIIEFRFMARAKDWRIWVEYAESNWRAASGWLETQPSEAAYYFAQSAEKYLMEMVVHG